MSKTYPGSRPKVPILSRRMPARFRLNASEISGSLGDLGTFLPYVVGAVTVAGMAPTGILYGFGGFYIASGLIYGLPMAVQPMKAASAAMLVHGLSPMEMAAAGLIIGAFFLIAGITGLITRIAQWIPAPVAAGLQLGLGISLAILGIEMIIEEVWLGLAVLITLLILLQMSRVPAVLLILVAGVAISRFMSDPAPFPELDLGLHLPAIGLPNWDSILRGTELAVLPQIPLTLTNAIIVTVAVTRQLYPDQADRVTPRTLSLTTGIANLCVAPFGGYLMCHGAGGVAAHHRFGARTGAAPLLIGSIFVLLAMLFGDSSMGLLLLIPMAVVGGLLFFAGLELARSGRPWAYGRRDLIVIIVIAAIGILINLALAFAIGLALILVLRWRGFAS